MASREGDVLGDANPLLRSASEDDPLFEVAVAAINRTFGPGDRIVIARQSFAELWSVATRPVVSLNGLGLSPAEARSMIDLLRRRFPVLPEPDDALNIWLDLVMRYGVSGKTTHDVPLVATLLDSGVRRLLTFNIRDFVRSEAARAKSL